MDRYALSFIEWRRPGSRKCPSLKGRIPGRLGIISLADLLQARARDLEQEHRRQRVLSLRLPFGGVAPAPIASNRFDGSIYQPRGVLYEAAGLETPNCSLA